VAVGAVLGDPDGDAGTSVRSERFAPLGSIGGIRTGRRAAERGLGHRPIGGQPRSVDADLIVVVEQVLAPDLWKTPARSHS
jgi:hypothetical protein